jgi:hypothetical protein
LLLDYSSLPTAPPLLRQIKLIVNQHVGRYVERASVQQKHWQRWFSGTKFIAADPALRNLMLQPQVLDQFIL